MSTETCQPHHDIFTDVLTAGLCVGLVISYLPQHLRIILSKSSEGFSPWFLLLGSTSAAAGLLNIVVKQWDIVKCCRVLSAGNCIEATAGIFQLSLQWICFTMILVLYMIYYPAHLKYTTVSADMHDTRPPQYVETPVKQDDWRLSITLAWVVFLFTALLTFVTFLLLASPLNTRNSVQIDLWATFLGVTSTLLAAFQYLPQIVHTYSHKLVGALSMSMMVIQTPGSILMVASIVLRPGTNWTTWAPYAVAGILQGSLLVMCIVWKSRQHKLGIDDFGKPLEAAIHPSLEDSPIPITQGPDDGLSSSVHEAIVAAVETDVRVDEHPAEVNEDTPLLKQSASSGDQKRGGWWLSWLRG